MNKLTQYCLAFLCLSHLTWAAALPENHSVNGGLTIIPVEVKKKPEAYYQNKRIPVLESRNANQWLLVVAIPLSNRDTIQYLDIKSPYKAVVPFQVSEKFYNTQSLHIKDLSKVDPQPADQVRIEQEVKKLNQIYARFSDTNPFEKEFTPPLKGAISSMFGLRRLYNNQPRDPHSGLDIAASEGQPVYAVNKGVVAETGDYFFTGNTVIIDHGMGVFSLYAHLSRIDVNVGQTIEQGEEVGLVGMTGRVTGPHLHWTMIVNQTLVDPLLFVPIRQIATTPAPAKTQQPITAVKS